MKWETISLGDIALRKGGSVDPKKHPDEVFELYSIPAFDAGAPEIASGSAIGSSKKAVQTNDVMISRIVPHIRRACVVGQANGHRQIASGEWIIFRDDSIWPQYLRWVLVGDVFHSAFMRTVSGVGGSLLRARPAEVFKIKIPLPPLAEQKRIAGILDAADALRAKRSESLAQLDMLLQSTFLDMFGDPVINPMGWEVGHLGDALQVKGGYAFKSADYLEDAQGAPLIRIGDVNRRDFISQNLAQLPTSYFEEFERFVVSEGAILMSLTGTVGKDDYGNAVTLRGDTGRYLLNQRVAELIPSDDLDSTFLHGLISHERIKRTLTGRNRGVRQANISNKDIQQLKVPFPPLSLQRRFAAIVESIERQKARQRAHLAELDTLFASLQSRAFRGDL